MDKANMGKEEEVARQLAAVRYNYVELFPLARYSDEFLYHIHRCQEILSNEASNKKSPYYRCNDNVTEEARR